MNKIEIRGCEGNVIGLEVRRKLKIQLKMRESATQRKGALCWPLKAMLCL